MTRVYKNRKKSKNTKVCSICKIEKPLSDYYSNRAKSTRTYSSCRECFKSTLIYPKVSDFKINFSELELKKEVWKDIVVDGEKLKYRISNLGRLFSKNKNDVCKYSYDQRGYPQVVLYGSKRISRRIHRLVAIAYIPNPENKREVNHKDGNKLNTRASNMEWVTSKENTNHAFKIGIRCN